MISIPIPFRILRSLKVNRRITAFLAVMVIILGLLSSTLFANVYISSTLLPSYAQSSFTNITSYRVDGSPNYTSPGSESFWNVINWTSVPLAASVSPGGGHTPNLLVKSANDGFYIYMLLRWNDTSGPSFASNSEMYTAPNGTLLPLPPGPAANITQLFYNSTYYYPDRAAILWFIANQSERKQSPAMQLGTNGAITGGAAEIWHWQSNPTDNNPNDTGFPGGYTDTAGNPIYPPENLSFAEDDYTNTTGFFIIAGSFGANASNLVPNADPFDIHVGSYYSFANKTWTVEMVRSFTTSDAPQYRVQLKTGSSYFMAMAVWQGKLGESAEFKSVSQWYNITISSLAPPSSPSPSPVIPNPAGSVTIELAIIVAVSALIVGIVIGTVVRPSASKK